MKLPTERKREFAFSSLRIEKTCALKAEPSIISTDAGIENTFNREHSEKAFFSIRIRLDFDSNVTVSSSSHQ
jgi:hypothetical protein